MKIIFAGTPVFAQVILSRLLDSHHDVVAVLTQPDRPSGRGQKMLPSPVKETALAADLPVLQPLTLKDPTAVDELKAYDADAMVVAAYGLILPKTVLSLPKYGCLNVHGSLLPRWRGAAPIQRAILAGDKETGVTIMQMAEGLDTGDMLLKETCEINATDTTATLHDALAELGAENMVTVLNRLDSGEVTPVPQDDNLATYADKISKQEAEINWQLPASTIGLQIRAYNPFPIAYSFVDGQRLKLWLAEIVCETATGQAGQILSVTKAGVVVQTGLGQINLQTIQLPGKKPMAVRDAMNANQFPLTVGTVLG